MTTLPMTPGDMHRAMQELHGRCDGAVTLDGLGFSKSHASIGAYLAETPPSLWTPDDHATAWYLCQYHHRQLAHYGVEIPPAEDKDETAWQSTLSRAQTHASRPVRLTLHGQGSDKPQVHVHNAKGKVKKYAVEKVTLDELQTLVPDPSLYDFTPETFEYERQRLTGLSLSIGARNPYNRQHRLPLSFYLRAGKAALPHMDTLWPALRSVPGASQSPDGRVIELPVTEAAAEALSTRLSPQRRAGMPYTCALQAEEIEAAFTRCAPYAGPYDPERHNLYWEPGKEGGRRLMAYGPYSDTWLRQARQIEGRFWNGEADEFPANRLDEVLALLGTRSYSGPLGVSHLTPQDLAEVRAEAARLQAHEQQRAAEEQARREEAERLERERVAVYELEVDGKPHVIFEFPYDPPRTQKIKDECSVTFGKPPKKPKLGWYAPLSDQTLPHILRAAERAELNVSPDLTARFAATRGTLKAREAQEAQALSLIQAERAGQEAAAPALPSLTTTLKGHQHLPVAVWPLTGRMLLADEQGLGKSLEAITVLLHQRAADGSLRAVIVCPSNLTQNWEAEFSEHTPGAFQTVIATGRTPQPITPGTEVVIIGWAILSAWLDTLRAWQPGILVADEGQLAKSGDGPWGSQRGDAALQLAESVRGGGGGVMILTGTPIDTRPLDALALFKMLGTAEALGGEQKFKDRYCGPQKIRVPVPVKTETDTETATVYEQRIITTYKGASHTQEFHRRLFEQAWYVRRTKRLLVEKGEMQRKVVNGVDWYDYRTPQQPTRVSLSAQWQELYDVAVKEFAQFVLARLSHRHPGWEQLSDKALASLIEQELSNVLPKLTLMREVLGHAKIDAVCARVQELNAQGEQVVVIAHHREVVDEYARRLCPGPPLKIQGGMSVRAVEAAKRTFNTQGVSHAPVIVLSQDAAKLGHTLCLQRKLAGLPEARYAIIAEEGYNASPEAQAMDRIWRIGQSRVVYVENILAADTLDEGLFQLKLAKRLAATAITDGEAVDGDADLTGMLSAWIHGLDFREAAQQGAADAGEDPDGTDLPPATVRRGAPRA